MNQILHRVLTAALSSRRAPSERGAPPLRWGSAALLGCLALLGACGNLSGLGGSSEMTCSAPPGVPCMSVSGVHANVSTGALPAHRSQASGAPTALGSAASLLDRPARAIPLLTESGDASSLGAIRSAPQLLRIWLAPWQDGDGDLHSDSYVYLQVDSGRWLIEHNRDRIRREFAPLSGPGGASGGSARAPAMADRPVHATSRIATPEPPAWAAHGASGNRPGALR